MGLYNALCGHSGNLRDRNVTKKSVIRFKTTQTLISQSVFRLHSGFY